MPYVSELSIADPATSAFTLDESSGPGSLIGDGVVIATVDDGYRTAFISFAFADLPAAGRTTILDRMLDWMIPEPACVDPFIRGDANGSGGVDVADAVTILEYLFSSGAGPSPIDAADPTNDGAVDIADAIYLLAHLFDGGPPPAAPYPEAGCP